MSILIARRTTTFALRSYTTTAVRCGGGHDHTIQPPFVQRAIVQESVRTFF